MLRRYLWLLVAILLAALPWALAHAQTAPTAPHPAAPSPPPALTPPTLTPPALTPQALTPEQARAALDTLNDPRKRAAFAATLEALVKSQPRPDPPPPAPDPPPAATPATPAATTLPGPSIQLEPDSLGAQVLLTASAFLSETADSVPRAMKAAQSIPLLWGWLVVMVTNPLGQQLLANAAWRLAVTLVLAEAMALALRFLLRRPMARLLSLGRRTDPHIDDDDPESRAEAGAIEPPQHRRPHSSARRAGLGLARFALQMVPVLGLLVAGHAVAASSLGGSQDTRLIIIAVLEAIAVCQTLLAILTLLFMPEPPGLKILPLSAPAGLYLTRWGRRLILIAVPGYALGEVALLLGLSPPAHGALQKAVGLALTVCLAIIVVQRRRPVRRWLSAPAEATGVLSRFRNGLARYWYWAALFFLAASWLSWTLRAPDAMAHTLWYFMATVAVLFMAEFTRLALMALLNPIDPTTLASVAASPGASSGASFGAPLGTDIAAANTAASPGHPVRSRLSVYHPALSGLARVTVSVLAVLALLQLYGLGGLNWLLTNEVGHRMMSGCFTLAVTIALAFAVWEGVNIAIQTHLDSLRRDAQAARTARLRTLLPLIRTTLAITVVVVAGLMVLSEIGVNIAPLLAGAGIVGVAIGFGSQKLVQDVITGVFLLLENTMQVGDVAKVGDQVGVVESLSVRTIRLRTEDASVVVIPFSAVTTVVNMTRDYSRAVIVANIAANEDVDRVIETMRAIVREMREEAAWSDVILDELEVWGVDRFTDTAVQIKCRIMCTPFGRWTVGREYNRRMQQRFQMVGLATSFSALRLPSEPRADDAAWSPPGSAAASSPRFPIEQPLGSPAEPLSAAAVTGSAGSLATPVAAPSAGASFGGAHASGAHTSGVNAAGERSAAGSADRVGSTPQPAVP
jgi:small-conductance mechanosensitive channel